MAQAVRLIETSHKSEVPSFGRCQPLPGGPASAFGKPYERCCAERTALVCLDCTPATKLVGPGSTRRALTAFTPLASSYRCWQTQRHAYN